MSFYDITRGVSALRSRRGKGLDKWGAGNYTQAK